MKIVLWLPHTIAAFEPQPAQLSRWRARHPQHEWRVAVTEADFLAELVDAHAALVWGFSAAWYERAPQLRFVATPAAGREKLQPDPSGRVRALHGSFHGKIMAESLLGMLLSLLLLTLLLLPASWSIGPLLDNWLRDPFLRLRGTHPPSWPRRHLMLSVLRH